MTPITVSTIVNADIGKVWKYWNEPEHIEQWAFASDDWQCTNAKNDLTVGGKLTSTMSAKDGSASFDFDATYTNIIPNKLIEYTLSDGRKVCTVFEQAPGGVTITQTFDPESENPPEMQREGWQAYLDNFKKHAENS